MGEVQYNEDELIHPDWMDSSFFEKVLKDSEGDQSIKVTSLEIKPASKLGEHYASVMYRGMIVYDTKSAKNLKTSLVVKTMPFVEGNKKTMLSSMGLFDAEIRMYNDVIPLFNNILQKSNDDTELCGKCLFTSTEPQETLVFEDLSRKGYIVLPTKQRSAAFNKIAISKLAKWHAASFKLASEGNTNQKTFKSLFFREESLKTVPYMTTGFPDFVAMVKSMKGYEKYVSKLEKMLEGNFLKKFTKPFVDYEDANLTVLNHGDYHLRNLMVKSNDKKEVEDILLVDFQICVWGAAVIDVLYLIYCLLDTDTRMNRRDETIHYYFEVLTKSLKEFGFTGPMPKLSEFLKDFYTFSGFEILLATTMLPFVIACYDENNRIDPDKALNSDVYRVQFYSDPVYRMEAKQFLPYFLHRGYLD